MSRRSFFKRKEKVALPPPAVPRQLSEIIDENNKLMSTAAQKQYLVFVYSEELKAINNKLLSLNQEAAARQALDKEAKEKAAEDKEATNE